MKMNAILDQAAEAYAKALPKTHALCNPRRIVPPNGYTNPRHYGTVLTGSAMVWQQPSLTMVPHICTRMDAYHQAIEGVPTFFVGNEFCQAVQNTQPPEDFKFSDLKWPRNSMLFVLPDTFVRSQFKYAVPFISVSRVEPGDYPNARQPDWDVYMARSIHVPEARINFRFTCFYANQSPCDYTGTYPLDLQVSQIADAPFADASYMEEALWHIEHTVPEDGPKDEEEDKQLQCAVISFATKLMLALTARPEMVTEGTCVRPARIRRGVVTKDELWSPNMIGWEYRAKHSVPQGGTHASPRMHWRRGHMRNQVHGEGRALRKLMWIEPMLVSSAS